MVKEKKKTILDAIIESEIFLALGTENYLKEIEDPKSDVALQVKAAKKFNKPTIILIDTKLPEEKKIDLDRYFVGLNIIGVVEIEWKDDKSMDKAIKEIVEIMKKHGIKTG